MISRRLCTVQANGKRFFVLSEANGKVYCQGDILEVAGFATKHGTDKCFLASRVTVREVDITEELLAEMAAESPGAYVKLEVKREIIPVNVEEKWVETFGSGTNRVQEITDAGRKGLILAGYEMAQDFLTWNKDENPESLLQDMAMDLTAYHGNLTRDGVREGHAVIIRECAADYVYEGCLNALKEKGLV